MKVIIALLILFSCNSIFGQKLSESELGILVDSIYSNIVGHEKFEDSWKRIYSDIIEYERLITFKQRKKTDQKAGGDKIYNYTVQSYFEVEYKLCPEYSIIYLNNLLKINSEGRLDSTSSHLNLNQIPESYWTNDSCSVLDTSAIWKIADTIKFKKGPYDRSVYLTFNSDANEFEWIISNVIYDSLEEFEFKGKKKKHNHIRFTEQIRLNGKTGVYIDKEIKEDSNKIVLRNLKSK